MTICTWSMHAAGVTGHPIPAGERNRRPADPAILVASADLIRAEPGRATELDLDRNVADAWAFDRRPR